MKTSSIRFNTLAGTALLILVSSLTLLATSAMAQDKGAERLTKLQRLDTPEAVQKVQAGDTIVMSCPKCKDTWVTVVEKTGKAVQPEIQHKVPRHECPGCGTAIMTEGHGKAKTTKMVHTCKECGSKDVSCCVMKKGAGPTKGMEGRDAHPH